MTMWGGRFEDELDPRIEALNESFSFDVRLLDEDVQGSIAWARALRRAGILKEKELRAIVKGLERIAKDPVEPEPSDEDVHTYVERRLVELTGDAGKKLHTGRSRNDQVATDLHLWLKSACGLVNGYLQRLAHAVVKAAERAGEIAIPAYTHLQRAQPVLFAHHLLAYVEMLSRDRDRMHQACKRADVLPLGCGAAVGTGHPIDRRALAKDLGFKRVSGNSLDAVGSRDAALEFLAACSILGVHLSRLGEEVVLWSSAEFGFVRLSDRVSTGSSLLPQKRNPDGAELARGKAGRLAGHFVALAMAIKGLPLAYNKDLQEDKEACFDALDTVLGVCAAMSATLDGMVFDAARCAAALGRGHVLATELADELVRGGKPFREAHGIVGRLVHEAEQEGREVVEPTPKAIRAALASKRAIGGTAPARVRQALKRWHKTIVGW